MPTVDKRISELAEASSVDLTMDYLAIDNVRDGTRKCKPLDIGAKYSLEQDETDSHVFHFTGTDGTDVTITTTDTIYSITQSGHSFTLVGSNGYEYTVAIPYDSVSMTQAEYNALTPAQKADGTARFITDAISTEESELWSRVGRGTLHTDAQVISNAVNELKDVVGSGDLDTTSQELIGAVNELNSSLNTFKRVDITTSTATFPSTISIQGNTYYEKIGRLVVISVDLKIISSNKGWHTITNFIPTANDRPEYQKVFMASNGDVDGLGQSFNIEPDGRLALYNTKTGTTYCQGTAIYISRG